MATPHELHFTVSQNGVEDPSALHDPASMPSGVMDNNNNNNGGAGSGDADGGNGWTGRLAQSSHPMVCIFHVLFKGLALFMYIFGGWFASDGHGGTSGANFITVTVVVILLLALDFWTVKNVTGRLLVGLRWWNKVEGDTTTWIFECAKDQQINKFDSSVFWTVLYATPAVWFVLMILGILRFNVRWLIIDVMALSLAAANVYGYYKCSSDQKAQFQQMMQRGAEAGTMSMITSSVGASVGAMSGTMMSWIAGSNSSSNNNVV
eukprot:CAMPEP_0113487020 /NCGR_PEP_ID=MMETSP0014_2-20120614/25296_1 /TAXON_ID=2857 /ORGANISM="Nitzschia sp." /LENGTH=262 /DNA_ID=CAMNT_0000380709 /DNA_START=405 /DNA_END=1193 /DNA_ORIENTATION=- /assembly_acc=CAM_ASM_000159